jgi:citrate synthase
MNSYMVWRYTIADGPKDSREDQMSESVRKGLEGIIVADSAICTIDGQKGSLKYRGFDIADLAPSASYEETAYLLWFGDLPTENQLDNLKRQLATEREIHESVWEMITALPCWPVPMEALRTAVSSLSSCDPEANDHSQEANINKAIRLTAKMPTVVAYHFRHSRGKERIAPHQDLGHAANFLYMLTGVAPTALEERAIEMAMVLMAEHGFNASTFSARITASTLSDMYSAITTAIGTLKGPLHGGANQRAMEMLLEIGDIDKAEAYVDAALESKKRIMGFGHRVYKTMDPRARALRGIVCDLDSQMEDPRWCRLGLKMIDLMEQRKSLYPNVDFLTAPLLYTLGIPLDLFTPIFALSRIAGWTAHVMEQYADNRLIRPLSNYIGPAERTYVPIEQR